jgi:hypothetical protein
MMQITIYTIETSSFNFALEFTNGKVQSGQGEMTLNGTYQFLICIYDVNLLDENINTTKNDTKTLLVASKEGGTEVNIKQNKYIYSCCAS